MSFSCWAINDICERAMEGCLCMVKVLDVRTGLPHQNLTTSRKSSDFDVVALEVCGALLGSIKKRTTFANEQLKGVLA